MISHERFVFKVVTGSHAYGLNVEGSDYDYKSVYVPTLDDYLSLSVRDSKVESFYEEVKTGKTVVDTTIFSINKFFSLLLKSNPGALEMVYSDPLDFISFDGELKELIMNHRHLFFDDVGLSNAMRGMVGSYYRKFIKSRDHLLGIPVGLDYKSLMHALRLTRMHNEFLRNREFIVKRERDKDYLLSIRSGLIDTGFIMKEIDELLDESESLPRAKRDPTITQKLREVSHSYVRNVIKNRG